MNRPYGSYEGAAFVPAFLCGTQRISGEGRYDPPDFGGAHRPASRLYNAGFGFRVSSFNVQPGTGNAQLSLAAA